jgi:2-C-methyl-D-erythritol 4-phosphate cytidylyltransferase
MAVTAIVAAGGQGLRMKGDAPKQFLMLGDRPILFHSLQRLAECPRVDDLIVVVPADHLKYTQTLLHEEYPLAKPSRVVPGGEERQDSVRAGLEELSLECDLVVVHDAVRPLVSNALLVAVIQAAEKDGAATAAIQPADTIKLVDSDRQVSENLPRSMLWQIQTPQAYRKDLLVRAHQRAFEDNFYGTDDSILLERMGVRVRLVPGHPRNLKITTPDDLIMAEALFRHP